MYRCLGKVKKMFRLTTQVMRLVKQVAGPVVDHLMNIEEKRQQLKRKFEELESIEDDNKTQLKIAEAWPRKKRKRAVDHWLTNVGDVREKVQSIQQAEGQSRWNPFDWKRIDRITEEVKELTTQGKFPGGLFLDVPETRGHAFLVTKLVGNAFQVNMDKILAWLEKDEVWSIGVCGMGGVGKTTLASHIYNELLEQPNRFVHWITVSQDFSIYKLQDQVAKVTHVDISHEEDLRKRAAKISDALIKLPQFVFFFDNLWNEFTPEDVGIPIANGCKIVLTTRSFEVCRRMWCEKTTVKLKPLPVEESWNLFSEKLGNYVALPLEIKHLAKSVSRRCAGLPLRIVTMARSLRGVADVSEWRNVLQKMEESNAGQGEIEDEVLLILKFSYIRLKDPTVQLCFLYCALFPRVYKIKREELIEYMIAEGIITGLNDRQADYDEGHSILNKLENVCLLEGITERGKCRYVKMHDLIGEMAVKVLKETSKVMIQAGKRLKELPDESQWTEDLEKVSLMDNDIQEISWSRSPRCPNLSTLLLCRNRSLRSIGNCFFKQLGRIKILDLSHTAIKVLPHSVSNLVSLTSLLLGGCNELWHIPSMAKLKALTKLDLSHTGVEELPQGLEFMSHLKYLDVYGSKIQEFPSDILPKLCNLQHLMLGPMPKVEELICLRRLEYLRCIFPEPGGMFRYVSQGLSMLESDTRKLPTYYDLFAGKDDEDFMAFIPDVSMLSRQMLFSKCEIGVKGNLVALPKCLQMLYIMKCHDARSLCNASPFEGSTNLKFCEIDQCEGLEYLISFPRLSSSIFESVEILRLVNLENFRVIIEREGSAPQPLSYKGTFSCLQRLEVFDCPSMKSLFPSKLLQNLQNLEEIVVADCVKMEEIIASEDQEGEGINREEECDFGGGNGSIVTSTAFDFPKLKLLKLAYLPELKEICRGKMICESIQDIFVLHCLELKRIPLSLPMQDSGQPSTPPSLRKILMLPNEFWDAVEWDHPDAKEILQPFDTAVASDHPVIGSDLLSLEPIHNSIHLECPKGQQPNCAPQPFVSYL